MYNRTTYFPFTASFSDLPGLNLGIVAAGMSIFLPVWGF